MNSFQRLRCELVRIKLAVFLSCLLILPGLVCPVRGDVTVDGSLGPKGPIAGPNYVIGDNLGRMDGANLFHSFGRFNVMTGESATFTGPNGIQNIISRVSGGTSSFIDGGLISTIPGSNLFFFNPSGVMFGPNAWLDIPGGFHVSTADDIRLADGGIFYADPAENSVFTSAPPQAFGFLDNPSGTIRFDGSFLVVGDGQALSAVGGDIEVNAGVLWAPGGVLHMASAAAAGEVAVEPSGKAAVADAAAPGAYGQVDVLNGAWVGTSYGSSGGGLVVIEGGRFTLKDGSAIGSEGDIFIKATDSMVFTSSVDEKNRIDSFSWSGDAGNVDLVTGTLVIENTDISSSSWGVGGRSGDVTIDAGHSVSISTRPAASGYMPYRSSITSQTASGDSGRVSITTRYLALDNAYIGSEPTYWGDSAANSGDILINVDDMTMTHGSNLSSDTYGSGSAGDIVVNATGTVSILHTVSDHSSLGTGINSDSVGSGSAGNIVMNVGRLVLENGAFIFSDSYWSGDGGSVRINASESIDITGDPSNYLYSWISSDSLDFGDGGTVSLTTPELTADFGKISANASGSGGGGNVRIATDRLTLRNGASISSETTGTGPGGFIDIKASEFVNISGNLAMERPSWISGDTSGSGDGGRVTVATADLVMEYGGIRSLNAGFGMGGDIFVDAGTITMDNIGQVVSSTVGFGDAGAMYVVAHEAITVQGAQDADFPTGFLCNTHFFGDAGIIDIRTPELLLENGTIQAGTEGFGNGGDVYLGVGKLSIVGDVANIDLGSYSFGDGGNLRIEATESVSIKGDQRDVILGQSSAGIYLQANDSGDAGNLVITTPSLTIDGGVISGTTSAWGKGGDITIASTGKILFSGENSGIHSRARWTGIGGNIEVTGNWIELNDGAVITAESYAAGDAGSIRITPLDRLLIKDSAISTSADVSDGGNIAITPGGTVFLVDGVITATVGGGADTTGGNILLATDSVVMQDSMIIANAYEGKGGNIRISTDVFLKDAESVISASSALGIDGTVDIEAPLINLIAFQIPLPPVVYSAADLLIDPCMVRLKGEAVGSFVIKGRDGLPVQPGGLLPSPILPENDTNTDDETLR